MDLFEPSLSRTDIVKATRMLDRKVLTRGRLVRRFEERFADLVGAKHAIAVSSGTAALHVAVRALGWGQGDRVVTTPYTYIASTNALLYEGVLPVYVDIDKDTLSIDARLAEAAGTSQKIAGCLMSDVLGQIAPKLPSVSPCIEDACQSLPAPGMNRQKVGTRASLTAFSFNAMKVMTTGGEGGMLTTDSFSLAARARSLMDQGRSSHRDWKDHTLLGYNYRLPEILAAIGLTQLDNLPRALNKRERLATQYYRRLRYNPGVFLPNRDMIETWFTFFIKVANPAQRRALLRELKRIGIAHTYPAMLPTSKFSHVRAMRILGAKDIKGAERSAKEIVLLPMHANLSIREIDTICEAINRTTQ